MKYHLLSLFAVIVLSLFSSCEGPEGEPGPAGLQGEPGPAGQSSNSSQGWTYEEGFVKATATGTLQDGTPFSYDLNFQGNSNRFNTYSRPSSPGTIIRLERFYSGDGESLAYGSSVITFRVTNMNNLSNPTNLGISIIISKDLGDGTFRRFTLNGQAANSTLSNLNYNDDSGILTGNFSMNIAATSEHGPITVSNGLFSVRIANFVERKAAN